MSTPRGARAPRGLPAASRGAGARRTSPASTMFGSSGSIHAPQKPTNSLLSYERKPQPAAKGQTSTAARGQRGGLTRSRYAAATVGQSSRGGASSATRGKSPNGTMAGTQSAVARTHGTVAANRDPTKAASRAVYMKEMTDVFPQLKERRERERKAAIRDGFMADPDKKTSLAEAITPVGTCQDMCPEFERVERVVQMMVDRCERKQIDDASESVPWEPFMLKRFRRSAAGTDDQIPSDIRPPPILRRTLDYLLDDVVGGAQPLATVHKFVWDRTRAIRNDFSIQQVTRVEDLQIAIECFERIARFHLLSLHQLSRPGRDNGDFDAHQEREQLGNTLLSLMYYYDDSRAKIASPNEPEFRAYCIIFEIQDRRPDLEDRVQRWPKHLLRHPRVQTALKLYAAASSTADDQGPLMPRVPFAVGQANHGRFWSILASPAVSYLSACAAEVYFNHVRSTALETIYKAFRRPTSAKLDDLTLDALMEMLGFENEDETQSYCEDHGFVVKEREDGNAFIDLNSVSGRGPSDSNSKRRQTFSKRIVEAKRHSRSLPAVIRGIGVQQAKAEGLLRDDSEDEMHEETLFLSDEDEDTPTAPTKQAAASAKAPFHSTTPSTPFGSALAQIGPASFQQTQGPASGGGTFAPKPNSAFGSAFSPAGSGNPFAVPQSNTNPFQQSPFTADLKASGAPAPKNPFLPLSNQEIAASIFGPKPGTDSSGVAPSPFASTDARAAESTPKTIPSNPFASFAASPEPEAKTAGAMPVATKLEALPVTNLPPFPPNPAATVDRPSNAPLTFTGDEVRSTSATSENKFPASTPSANTGQIPSFTQAAKPPDAEQNSNSLFPTSSTPTPSTFTQQQSKSPLGNPNNASTTPANKGFNPPSTLPKKSSPLSRPALTPLSPTADSASRHTEPASPKQRPSIPKLSAAAKQKAFEDLSTQMFLGAGGVLEMFIETILPPIVVKAEHKVAREKERQAVAEARAFLLSVKFSRRWKKVAWSRALARKGRERRQALAQTLRSSVASSARSSMSPNQRPLDSAFFNSSLFASPNSNPAHAARLSSALDKAKMPPPQLPSTPNISLSKPNNSPSPSKHAKTLAYRKSVIPGHKRSLTTSSLPPVRSGRISKPAIGTSSFHDKSLQSHVLGDMSLLKQARRLVIGRTDTTQTDYFRLKALGIDPDTTLVPQTRKRTRSTDSTEDLPRKRESSRPSPPAIEPPAALLRMREQSATKAGAEQTGLQKEANIAKPAAPTAKAGEDDEIFARVRRVREAMADSEAWFKSTRESQEREEKERAELRLRVENAPTSRRSSVSTPSRASLRIQETGAHGLWEHWKNMVQQKEVANKRASMERPGLAGREYHEGEDEDEEDEGDVGDYGEDHDGHLGEYDDPTDLEYDDGEEEEDEDEDDGEDAEDDMMDISTASFLAPAVKGRLMMKPPPPQPNFGSGVAVNGFARGGTSAEDAIEL